MIPRRQPLKRSTKRIRRSRPRQRSKTTRATTLRVLAALWSAKVKAKNDGQCITPGWYLRDCVGPIDPAHAFPKGACPAVRYDLDFGLPLCRKHHEFLKNGRLWRALLFRLWGAERYAEMYMRAHRARTKPDYNVIRATLEAA